MAGPMYDLWWTKMNVEHRGALAVRTRLPAYDIGQRGRIDLENDFRTAE